MTHAIVVGLGFGDECKGATVDWLCATNDIKAVVRFNGGPQAAHNVITPDGRHHTFAQFGSGTFHGVPTYLSRYMLVNPFNLVNEAEHLADLGVVDPLRMVWIDQNALLVTPYHRHANRLREDARGASRHGSTGQGVGETRAYAIERPDESPKMGDIYDEALRRSTASPGRTTRVTARVRSRLSTRTTTGTTNRTTEVVSTREHGAWVRSILRYFATLFTSTTGSTISWCLTLTTSSTLQELLGLSNGQTDTCTRMTRGQAGFTLVK